MTFRNQYLKNRFIEIADQTATNVQARIYDAPNPVDKFSIGTTILAQNVNCYTCSNACGQCYTLCPGVCYPGNCFAPVSIFLGEAYGIAGCTCMPYRAWCHPGDVCTTQPCGLNASTCWTPLSKMCGNFAGLVIRVN